MTEERVSISWALRDTCVDIISSHKYDQKYVQVLLIFIAGKVREFGLKNALGQKKRKCIARGNKC